MGENRHLEGNGMAMWMCGSAADSRGRELVEHGTVAFPVAIYRNDLTAAEVPWHWHEEMETLVVMEGSVVVTAGGEEYTLVEGEGMFINAGVLHGGRRVPGSAGKLRSVVFHPRLVGGGIDSIFWQKYLQPLLKDSSLSAVRLDGPEPWRKEAVSTSLEAWEACREERSGYEFQVRGSLSHLVYLLASHRPAVSGRVSEQEARRWERIKIMLQFIQEHCGENITTADIARSAMISESECLRCFHSTIGTTPVQYLRQLRIQRAAELLASTDRRVGDIAWECGFSDAGYFAKTFREMKGCTPGQYRASER